MSSRYANWDDYLSRRSDVQEWINDAKAPGIFGTGGGYSRSYNRDTTGWEDNWIREANQMYGRNATDLGEYTDQELARLHYDRWGRSEGTSISNPVADYLVNAGYDRNLVDSMSDDDLGNISKTMGSDTYQRNERKKDREESLADFRSQLGDLTASKQRQAEQAGRLAQANTRQQGLSQMMSNF